MWLLYFVNGFNQSITGNLAPYITSEFEAHSLVPLIQVVSSIMGAATYMPLAKILNLWDRSVGFALMAGFATLGLILAASCKGIGVYCASQVFYSIGFTGMTFAIDVITADTSTLRDRGLAYAFTSSPYIITAYAGPTAAARFYENNWRWAYGAFAIILPVFAVPLVLIMKYARNQAKLQGLLPPAPPASNRTFPESVKHYIIEFDGKFIYLTASMISPRCANRYVQLLARSSYSQALF
jgi:MFS family permease